MEHSSVKNLESESENSIVCIVVPVLLSTVDETSSHNDTNKNLNYHLLLSWQVMTKFILKDCGAPPLPRGPG